jgi:antitoxin component of RelBE/YafQ-DinJ toxin-antitoxin module
MITNPQVIPTLVEAWPSLQTAVDEHRALDDEELAPCARLGMKPSDAFNIFLAQVELRNDLPFSINPGRF